MGGLIMYFTIQLMVCTPVELNCMEWILVFHRFFDCIRITFTKFTVSFLPAWKFYFSYLVKLISLVAQKQQIEVKP